MARTNRDNAGDGRYGHVALDDSGKRLLDELLAGLRESDIASGEEGARRELARIPAPLRPAKDPAAERRQELRRVVALLAAKDGRPQELVEAYDQLLDTAPTPEPNDDLPF